MNSTIKGVSVRNAHCFLTAFAKILKVSEIGVYTYDGCMLSIVGFTYGKDKSRGYENDFLRHDRMANTKQSHQQHSTEFYEIHLPKRWTNAVNGAAIAFKRYRFICLEDVAWHLKAELRKVEVDVARSLASQALKGGIEVTRRDGNSRNDVFKASSLEEVLVLGDLMHGDHWLA